MTVRTCSRAGNRSKIWASESLHHETGAFSSWRHRTQGGRANSMGCSRSEQAAVEAEAEQHARDGRQEEAALCNCATVAQAALCNCCTGSTLQRTTKTVQFDALLRRQNTVRVALPTPIARASVCACKGDAVTHSTDYTRQIRAQ